MIGAGPADRANSRPDAGDSGAGAVPDPRVPVGAARQQGAGDEKPGLVSDTVEAPAPLPTSPAAEVAVHAGTETEGRLEGPLRTLVPIVANITVLSALVVFFGWKRAQAHAEMLGISTSILGMSPQDYAFRSVDALFPLLAVVATVGLGWSRVHLVIARALQQRRRMRLLEGTARLLRLAWFLVPGICALFSWRFPQAGYLAFPLSFAAGILLACYGNYLHTQLQATRTGVAPAKSPAWHTALTATFVAVIVTLSLFWGVSNYATIVGQNLGLSLTAELPYLTRVVVYSSKRLVITAPQVKEEPLQTAETAYRFRYTGLRFLDHTGGNYFLVSDGWTPRYGVVVVLAETDPVRLEFVRDQRPPAPPSTN